MNTDSVLDVSRPIVGNKSIRHRSLPPMSLRDAIVEVRCDLADGTAPNPSILPEQHRLSIANHHDSRREKDRVLLQRELQVDTAPGALVVRA